MRSHVIGEVKGAGAQKIGSAKSERKYLSAFLLWLVPQLVLDGDVLHQRDRFVDNDHYYVPVAVAVAAVDSTAVVLAVVVVFAAVAVVLVVGDAWANFGFGDCFDVYPNQIDGFHQIPEKASKYLVDTVDNTEQETFYVEERNTGSLFTLACPKNPLFWFSLEL